MQDFIFGGIEADDRQLLATERARWQGIRHLQRIHPLDPEPGQPVGIRVTVGQGVHVDRVAAYVTSDGSDPAGERGVAQRGQAIPLRRTAIRWQPLIWGYVEEWQGALPGQPEGTLVQYRIQGWHSQIPGPGHWSREPNMEGVPELPALYGYHVGRHRTPAWAQEAVLYQIFVDRFARGPQGAPVHDGWLAPKQLNRFLGGDLQGITARLDYLAELGVTALWLSPIFATSSYHGYDTVDFYDVDPRFGTKADLRRLVQEAHARGLRVLLDFVANHVSRDFPPFQEALRDPASPYRAWFHFHPDYKHGYRCFFDVASMPWLNTDHPQVSRFLVDAARYWLTEFQVDGYRLDYAAGPSHRFWSQFRAGCKEAAPDCWLFGEVTRAGDDLRRYVGRLDGCLDFAFARAVRHLCAQAPPTISLTDFAAFQEREPAFFPADFLRPAFLDNHDMNRFLWLAGGDKRRLRLAGGLLFTLAGPPILYYGTEVGLSQPRAKAPHQEEARHPMPWGSAQDRALRAYFQRLIHIRRGHAALTQGDRRTLALDPAQGTWLFQRQAGPDRLLVAVNVSPEERRVELPGPAFTELLSGQAAGNHLALEPLSLRILQPQEGPS